MAGFCRQRCYRRKRLYRHIKNDILTIPCDAFGGADKAHKGFNLMQKAISYSMTSFLLLVESEEAKKRFQSSSQEASTWE
jgi:hypothetical protein